MLKFHTLVTIIVRMEWFMHMILLIPTILPKKGKEVSEFLVIKAFVLFVEPGREMYYNLVCTSRYHLSWEFLKS